MLEPSFTDFAFQIELEFDQPEVLIQHLRGNQEDLWVTVKPTLQNPDQKAPLSDKLNTLTWNDFWTQFHPDCADQYKARIHTHTISDNDRDYFILIPRIQANGSGQYIRYFCFTQLSLKEGHLYALFISLTADAIWSREVERFLREQHYRTTYRERYQNLTDREKEVLQLVAGGHTNPQVARKLDISRRTVESHRKNINRKLGIRNLAELVRFALAFDLV